MWQVTVIQADNDGYCVRAELLDDNEFPEQVVNYQYSDFNALTRGLRELFCESPVKAVKAVEDEDDNSR